jgi:hypothetical protein
MYNNIIIQKQPFAMKKQAFSFWKYNSEFVLELSKYLKEKKVLEIFAGNGLMASYLSENGVDITSTSLLRDYDRSGIQMHFPVVEQEALEAVLEFGSESDVLMMIWPETTPVASKAARLFFAMHKDNPSAEIIFIGEKTDYTKGWLGGCATDDFFEDFGCVIHRFGSYQGNYIEVAEAIRPSQK